jgi:lipoprotein signal peptidase
VKLKHLFIISLSLGIATLDVIFKYIALKRLPEEGGRFNSVIGFGLHKNPGIAFDIPIPIPIIIMTTLAIVIVLSILAEKQIQSKNLSKATMLIIVIIGSLGNMADRIINGFTTDYIILFNRSAINLSDLLIIFGILSLLLYTKDKDEHII